MLEKLLDKYIESKLPYKDTLMTYDVGEEVPDEVKTLPKAPKLEKKILSFFGILLQLIVFYLPLINMIFRGKAMPGIVS